MKILHALVGYLAVTALPFHPFAFASPVIDNDGYVTVDITQNPIDGALMKHVLGSILETCQTVTYHSGLYVNTTTQNHSDSALMKRVPGDIIEERQLAAVPPVLIIIAIVAFIVLNIFWIKSDDPVRGNDVNFLVEHFD